MANVHVVNVGIFNIDNTGSVIKKDNSSIGSQLMTSIEHRIIPKSSIQSSLNYPSVEQYLQLEAADGYVLQHMDQTTIITYLRNSSGGFA